MARKAKVNEDGAGISSVDSYIVLQPFQDAREHATSSVPQQYEAGDDVSDMDAGRLASLVNRGIVGLTKAEASTEA